MHYIRSSRVNRPTKRTADRLICKHILSQTKLAWFNFKQRFINGRWLYSFSSVCVCVCARIILSVVLHEHFIYYSVDMLRDQTKWKASLSLSHSLFISQLFSVHVLRFFSHVPLDTHVLLHTHTHTPFHAFILCVILRSFVCMMLVCVYLHRNSRSFSNGSGRSSNKNRRTDM